MLLAGIIIAIFVISLALMFKSWFEEAEDAIEDPDHFISP